MIIVDDICTLHPYWLDDDETAVCKDTGWPREIHELDWCPREQYDHPEVCNLECPFLKITKEDDL